MPPGMKFKALGNPVVLQSSRAQIAKCRGSVCFSWQQRCVFFFTLHISFYRLNPYSAKFKSSGVFAQDAPHLGGVSSKSETVKTNIVQMNLHLPVIGETKVAS